MATTKYALILHTVCILEHCCYHMWSQNILYWNSFWLYSRVYQWLVAVMPVV